jgi:chromosome segregation ATPase
MSLEKIERYIKELDAIKHYEETKLERKKLEGEVKELREKISTRNKEVEELTKRIKKLEEDAKKEEEEIGFLKDEIKEKDKKITHLNERVDELESLRTIAEGKTLKEAEEAFLKVEDEEIKKNAEETLARLKSNWEKDEKPKEVLNEAVRWLNSTIEVLSKPEPHWFLKEVADVGLPEKVEEIIGLEVKRRLDNEFFRRVEEESKKKALEKLNQMKNVEWPRWFEAYAEPKIRELEEKMNTNLFNLLNGPWTITCDKCGTKQRIETMPQGIEQLLRNGYMTAECSNPNCNDFMARHRKVELKAIIFSYISPSKQR